MFIAYILPVYWPAIGGCELHTHELVNRLSSQHSIKVITQITRQEDKPTDLWLGTLIRRVPRRKAYRDHHAHVIPIQMTSVERILLYPFVRYYRKMESLAMGVVKQVFQRKIMAHMAGSDLIHCIHNGASYYGYSALLSARTLRVPFIFTPLLQTHQALKESQPNVLTLSEKCNPSLGVGTLRALLSPRAYHDRFWLQVCLGADALVTMTDTEKRLLAREGVPPERIHAVGVGPILSDRPDGSAFRKDHGTGAKPIVLFLGRKHESKGIEEVLQCAPQVWAERPETLFFFVGPKEGNASKIFSRYPDNRIVEIDGVDLQEKSNAIAACDLLCMPSMNEALGGVFLEAWSLRKPVIAGDTPPLRELTGDGRGGFLVNLDPRQIAQKIITLLNDPGLRERMGRWGEQRVISRYTWEAITDRIERLYLSLLHQRGDERRGIR